MKLGSKRNTQNPLLSTALPPQTPDVLLTAAWLSLEVNHEGGDASSWLWANQRISKKKRRSPSLECCVGNYSRKDSFNYLGHEWTRVWILNFLIWQHTVFSPFHPEAEMCFVPISHNCENELYWLHLVNWFLLTEKGNIKDAMNSHIWIYPSRCLLLEDLQYPKLGD